MISNLLAASPHRKRRDNLYGSTLSESSNARQNNAVSTRFNVCAFPNSTPSPTMIAIKCHTQKHRNTQKHTHAHAHAHTHTHTKKAARVLINVSIYQKKSTWVNRYQKGKNQSGFL